jgi:hypothetical protein
MTYKGSNWTRGELGNVPDTNPTLACDGPCGRSWSFKDYWDGRWQLGDPATATMLCDECLSEAIDYHDRKTKNKEITEWCQ